MAKRELTMDDLTPWALGQAPAPGELLDMMKAVVRYAESLPTRAPLRNGQIVDYRGEAVQIDLICQNGRVVIITTEGRRTVSLTDLKHIA